jgi:hypothetical protein
MFTCKRKLLLPFHSDCVSNKFYRIELTFLVKRRHFLHQEWEDTREKKSYEKMILQVSVLDITTRKVLCEILKILKYVNHSYILKDMDSETWFLESLFKRRSSRTEEFW